MPTKKSSKPTKTTKRAKKGAKAAGATATNDDAVKPLLGKNWAKAIKARAAQQAREAVSVTLNTAVIAKEHREDARCDIDRKSGIVQVSVNTRTIGQHAFPPDIRTTALTRSDVQPTRLITDGMLHDHLGVSPAPAKLSKELMVRQRFGIDLGKRPKRDLSEPTNIFAGDQRYVFSDTSFPWCTCGKVETEAGWGSGVMIGPRHMMTASHVIVWKPNNSAGWVKFTPLKFDSSEPFGNTFAVNIYSWNKADGSDGLNLTEGAFDYVVCVLNNRIGDLTGWMGSRGYNTSWDGGDYWAHIGYPQDISGGTRPAFIGYQDFINETSASLGGRSSFRIRHEIDVIPGQSGGPYFGWWDGEPWPRVVGIQSGQNLGGPGGDNTCGGGNPLSELINFARGAMP